MSVNGEQMRSSRIDTSKNQMSSDLTLVPGCRGSIALKTGFSKPGQHEGYLEISYIQAKLYQKSDLPVEVLFQHRHGCDDSNGTTLRQSVQLSPIISSKNHACQKVDHPRLTSKFDEMRLVTNLMHT